MADERPELLPLAELIAGQRERLSLSLEGTRKRMQEAAHLEGKYCGATRQTIRAIERGDRIPHPDSLRWLAVGLDLPIEQVASAARQQRMKRRQLLQGAAAIGGAALLPDPGPWERLALALQTSPHRTSQVATGIDLSETIGYLGRAFTEFSTADWLLGPKLVLATVPEHLSLITELLPVVKGDMRTRVLHLGARYGEFASWLYQDRGKPGDAAYWADRAIEWAQQANNPLMVSYVLTRKSNQASARGDAPNAIGLAQAAQRQPKLTPRTLAVAIQQEAYGHALAGDERAAHALLNMLVATRQPEARHRAVRHRAWQAPPRASPRPRGLPCSTRPRPRHGPTARKSRHARPRGVGDRQGHRLGTHHRGATAPAIRDRALA